MNPVNGAYPRGGPQPNSNFFAQRGAGPTNNGPVPPRPVPQESPQQARLRQFEDDKKRLQASCCTPGPDEHKPQSYITHFRVEEDSMHQSGPPPPDASTHHKKPRVILLGVKSTGKVQMYKARENEDGTFQIGKTWDLDELQSIRVFNPATARTPEEQQQAQWAGPGGLTITMSKPYFWKALGDAEKVFFISGLVRVFRRYTKGRAPELIGFTPAERDGLLSGPSYVPPPQDGRPSSQNQVQPPPLRQQLPQQLPQQRSSSPSSSVHSSTIGVASSEPMQGPANPRPLQQQRPQPTNQPSSQRSNRDSRASSQQTPSPTSSFKAPPPQAFSQSQAQPQQARPFEPLFPPNHQTPAGLTTYAGRPSNASSAVSPTFLQPLNTSSGPAGASLMSPSEISPGTHSVSSVTAGRWRPQGVAATTQRSMDSPGSEQSPGSTPAPQTAPAPVSQPAPQPAPQIVPERRRPPLQDASVFGSQNSFRKNSNATEPSPLATQAPMQHDISPSNMQGEPLPEVLPLRSTPQKAKPPPQIIVQPEQERVPSPIAQAAPRQDSPSNDLPSRTTSPLDERQYRPGLGPMMGRQGSNETANKLRKAATAYSAFKPRAGGAGERLLGTKANTNDEPDGVTRVVPAPLSRNATQEVVPTIGRVASPLSNGARPSSPGLEKTATQTMDGVVERALPNGSAQPAVPVVENTEEQMARRPSKITMPKPRRQTDFFAKSLSTMGIDTSVVHNQHTEFENILTDFNWDANLLQIKQVDVLKTNLRRDIARLEAGSWLGDSEHKDDRVATVETLLDRAIAECDEMEGLLTLYSVELSTLNDDVAYIEAQSQGLQVQTANQKLLYTELQNLIATISLDASQLEPLRRAPLGDPQGLEAIEGALLLLYRALQTIDPALLGKDVAAANNRKDEQALSSMRVLQEKRSLYMSEAHEFLTRIRNYAEPTFAMAFQKAKETHRNSTSSRSSTQQDLNTHDIARSSLWQLRPLMIFAEDIDKKAWQDIIASYIIQARTMYQGEVQEMVAQWKKGTRRPGGEEQDALFTAQEKEADGLAGTARKLTVKRSQTLARMTRAASAEKRAVINRNQENKQPCEAFAGALEETIPLIFTEQNFIIDFFHSDSLSVGSADFVEAVTSSRPSERRGTNLHAPRRLVEGDRAMSQKLLGLMEGVFPTWPNEMQSLMDWALQADSFQGIGILCALERKRLELEDTNQEFIVRAVSRIYERLSISFNQFVDAQLRAIEETKVKINKRKGVIAFIKVFPNFSIIIENMLPPADGPERLETRSMVDAAYNKIIRSMFDSLKTIAKAAPMTGQGFSADPEDKEALNYHILLIENMFHFYNEVDERGDAALGQWRGKAMLEMSEHQELYVNAIIRRPMGKLLDFLDSAENLISRGVAPASIPSSHPSHSRSVYKKILGAYDAKEVRRGIDTLRKRIEKHFGEADDATISAELIKRITAECERKYNDVCDRANRVAGEMYEGSVQVDFTKQDISQAFRR